MVKFSDGMGEEQVMYAFKTKLKYCTYETKNSFAGPYDIPPCL